MVTVGVVLVVEVELEKRSNLVADEDLIENLNRQERTQRSVLTSF